MKNEKNAWKSITVIAVVLTVLAIAMVGTASAKSLYVIADINANPTPIQSYDIQAASIYLVYQTTNTVPYYGWGGVGLAIDTDSTMLFVTYEQSNTIQLKNATTMANEGTTTAPGASNLAGIVVDQDKSKVYTMDRTTNQLYVYLWDASTKTLTNDITTSPYYISLSGVTSAYGIALDEVNDLLYVGDLTTTVKIFNTTDWSSAGSFIVSQKVMGIAVDVANGFVYTGNAYPPYGSLGNLSKYDLNTNTETTVNITTLSGGVVNDNVVGLAVDPATGLLYVTTGNQGVGGSDRILVFDSNLNLLHSTGDIGNPTGIVVPGKEISYNPLNLNKDDGLAVGVCVSPGDTVTYTMTYTNGNPNTVTGVTLVDKVPLEVTVTSTGGGTQSGNTVTWNIGPLTTGQSGSKTLTVTVNSGATPGSTIDNAATINGNEPNTGPTTKHEYTDVCTNRPPVADAGRDQTVEQDSLGGASVTLNGAGSYDPDGDPLTYSWTWPPSGSATGVSPTVSLPLGNTTITLVVNDGTVNSTPDTVVITVQDTTPPVITCPANVTVEQANASGTVVPLTATATDICDASPTITSDELAIYPLGTTTVTFTATDDSGNAASCTTTVTVEDTTPPVITPSGEQIVLWPPNHKYRTVEISDCVISVTDICDAGVGIDDIVITSVSSDEPDDAKGKGDGKTVDDIVIVDSQTVELRAERQGDGNGRVYTINFGVTDDSGNTETGSCTVWVPHDQESGSTAIDDGVSYTVTP